MRVPPLLNSPSPLPIGAGRHIRLFVLHVFAVFWGYQHIWPKGAVFAVFCQIWWPYMWRFRANSSPFRHIWGFRASPGREHSFRVRFLFVTTAPRSPRGDGSK